MGITITVDTKDLDGPGFAGWMVVCYHIHSTDPLDKGRYAVDVPGDVEIMPPEKAARIPGAPRYDVDPKGAGETGTVSADDQHDVEICLVARKGPMREGELSLEVFERVLGGAGGMVERGWRPLPYDGAPGGMGPHWVPPAIAMTVPDGNAEHALLAARFGDALAMRRVLISPALSGPSRGTKSAGKR